MCSAASAANSVSGWKPFHMARNFKLRFRKDDCKLLMHAVRVQVCASPWATFPDVPAQVSETGRSQAASCSCNMCCHTCGRPHTKSRCIDIKMFEAAACFSLRVWGFVTDHTLLQRIRFSFNDCLPSYAMAPLLTAVYFYTIQPTMPSNYQYL